METILEDLLRWPPERVVALQVERLRTTIARCYEFHPYYREVMRKAGLTPDDVADLDDLQRLPVTTKADFVADPERFRLQLEDGPLEDRTLAQLMYTTGSTTGVPAAVYATASDHFDYMLRCRRRRDFIDLRPGDLVASLFPLTPFPMGAYARTPPEVSACGGSVLFTDPGHASGPVTPHRRLDEVVELVVANQPTVLWGIASFVLRFLRRVADGGGRLARLRMVMVTGERSSPQLVADLRAAMASVGGAGDQVVNRYGSTEQGSSMVECTPGSGFHDLAPDSVFMEVLDPLTGRRNADGEEGSLAFTHLNRTGTVLLRYAMGDLAALSHDPCPHCGRTGSARLVAGPMRSGDVTKVKGILVNMSGVCDALAALVEVRDFQLVLDRRDDNDILTVRTVAAHGDLEAARARIGELVRRTAHVTAEVAFVDGDELVRGVDGGKFARVVDRRPND